jgi:hypothetical protein
LRTLARYASRGIVIGFIATALTLLALPHFYSRIHELLVFPAVAAVAGTAIGAVVLAFGAMRRSRRPAAVVAGKPFLVTLAASILIALALFVMRAPERAWRAAPKLVVLCIDGGTWQIIDPLIEAGRLPNLARLKRDGAAAVLMSTDPSFSMVAWTTIGTGVQPEKHGIRSFYDTQDHLQSKRFWEVFEDNGHSIGLFRWWITWPPRVKNGFVIPDILARDATSFPQHYDFINQFRLDMKSAHSTPVSRKVALAWRFLRSGLRLETCLKIAVDVLPALRAGRFADFHIAARRAEIRLNADMYAHLLRVFQPEYTCLYDNGVDQMSHFYWQYYEPGEFRDVDPAEVARYGNAIPDYYVLHDEIIGWIVEHIQPSATIVVLSDHGFAADRAGGRNLYFPRGTPILPALGLDDEFYSLALGSRTFIESIHRDPTENSVALERAADVLNSLVVRESGVPLFHAWIEQEQRLQLDVSDSLLSLEGHVETPAGIVPLQEWFTTRAFTGTHHPEGIFIGRGPAFRQGHEGARAHLIDIAPTLLHTAGFPLSRELDGTVVWDWIADAFRSGSDVAWVDSYGRYDPVRPDVEVDEETLKKLRSLGYVR